LPADFIMLSSHRPARAPARGATPEGSAPPGANAAPDAHAAPRRVALRNSRENILSCRRAARRQRRERRGTRARRGRGGARGARLQHACCARKRATLPVEDKHLSSAPSSTCRAARSTRAPRHRRPARLPRSVPRDASRGTRGSPLPLPLRRRTRLQTCLHHSWRNPERFRASRTPAARPRGGRGRSLRPSSESKRTTRHSTTPRPQLGQRATASLQMIVG